MVNLFQDVQDTFPKWTIDAVVDIYERRPGDYNTVDRAAVSEILDRLPDVSDALKNRLVHYAGWMTR